MRGGRHAHRLGSGKAHPEFRAGSGATCGFWRLFRFAGNLRLVHRWAGSRCFGLTIRSSGPLRSCRGNMLSFAAAAAYLKR